MFARRGIRWVLLMIVALIGVVPAVSLAAQPEFYTRYDDVTFEEPFLTEACGFPVVVTSEGNVKGRNFYDKEGNIVRNIETYSQYRHIYTNPETGTTFTTSAPAVFKVEFNLDGSIRTFTVTGLQDNVTVRGEGSIFRDAGRIVMTEPFFGEITFEAGDHNFFRFIQGQVALARDLCAALAA